MITLCPGMCLCGDRQKALEAESFDRKLLSLPGKASRKRWITLAHVMNQADQLLEQRGGHSGWQTLQSNSHTPCGES
jgi:hypothetical protein